MGAASTAWTCTCLVPVPVGFCYGLIRMQIMLQPEELGAIDNWRFGKRMPSRASAVRELLRRGLAGEGFNLAEPGNPQPHLA